MADYNVNMKQWNGTSFDNVLPLAFNSKALGGKSYDDITQYTQSLVNKSTGVVKALGTYVGNGVVGEDKPTTITFDFYPVVIFVVADGGGNASVFIRDSAYTRSINGNDMITTWTANSVSFAYNGTSGIDQNNASGEKYHYAAFSDEPTEWTITSSGTWTVPRTGRYYIELYGNGGEGSV